MLNEEKQNEQYAYLTMVGDFDPAAITLRLGVIPSEAWRQGEMHPKRPVKRTFSRWSLYSRLEREQTLEAHISDVLAQLDERTLVFQEVLREQQGCLQLVGYFYAGYPGLHFTAQQIQGLATYGLCVDCDFYGLSS